MPRYTDDQIRALCAKVGKAESEEELNRIAQELRRAIKEHTRLAKDSLSVRMDLIIPRDRPDIHDEIYPMTNSYLAMMIRLACEQANAQGATLFLVDGGVLRPFIIYNLPKEYIAGIGTVRVGSQCCGRAAEHKKPWIVTDMLTDPLFADGRAGAEASQVRAAFSVPVLDGDTAIASLACHYTKPHEPTNLDIERNEVFAKLIAISLRGRQPFPIAEPFFAWAEKVPA